MYTAGYFIKYNRNAPSKCATNAQHHFRRSQTTHGRASNIISVHSKAVRSDLVFCTQPLTDWSAGCGGTCFEISPSQ
jgi:hypothetical protein